MRSRITILRIFVCAFAVSIVTGCSTLNEITDVDMKVKSAKSEISPSRCYDDVQPSFNPLVGGYKPIHTYAYDCDTGEPLAPVQTVAGPGTFQTMTDGLATAAVDSVLTGNRLIKAAGEAADGLREKKPDHFEINNNNAQEQEGTLEGEMTGSLSGSLTSELVNAPKTSLSSSSSSSSTAETGPVKVYNDVDVTSKNVNNNVNKANGGSAKVRVKTTPSRRGHYVK